MLCCIELLRGLHVAETLLFQNVAYSCCSKNKRKVVKNADPFLGGRQFMTTILALQHEAGRGRGLEHFHRFSHDNGGNGGQRHDGPGNVTRSVDFDAAQTDINS